MIQESIVVVADPDPGFRANVAHDLEDGFAPRDIYDAQTLKEAEGLLYERDGEAAVLVIGPGIPSRDALRVATSVQLKTSGVSVVLVVEKITASLLQAGMRSGVRDILPASIGAKQLREAVVGAADLAAQLNAGRSRPAAVKPGGGKIVTVFSSKGGVGKSFVASNLAVLLAERTRQEVVLVDLDLESGDQAIMLRLTPTRTFYDAAVNIDRLDAEAMRRYVTPYRNGVGLLSSPLEPGLVEKISPESVRNIFELLRQTYKYVVVDGPSFFTEQVLAALDVSDECILVASLDIPSIKNLKLALRTLELVNFQKDRVRIVLNRADSKVGLNVNEVERAIRRKIEDLVPSSREVPTCINRGVPVVTESRKSGVTAALTKLADAVRGPAPARAGAEAPAESPAPRIKIRRRQG